MSEQYRWLLRELRRAATATATLVALAGCEAARGPVIRPRIEPPPKPPAEAPEVETLRFDATAYSLDGITAAGGEVQNGIVAADPDVLPLGSRIRVRGAGNYSGLYRVCDTGRLIKGREIDIYMPSTREAKQFGRRQVQVEVLEYGDGSPRGECL